MPLDNKTLLERDVTRNIAKELLQSVRDIKAGRVGRVTQIVPGDIHDIWG